MMWKALQEFGGVCMDEKGEGKGWDLHSKQEKQHVSSTGAETGIAGPGGKNPSLAGPVGPQQDA